MRYNRIIASTFDESTLDTSSGVRHSFDQMYIETAKQIRQEKPDVSQDTIRGLISNELKRLSKTVEGNHELTNVAGVFADTVSHDSHARS
jgi:hypothetical protein